MVQRLRIVIAETDSQMLDFFTIAVKSLGHHLVEVVTSIDGLVKACAAHSPELVICALTLTDGDGIEAASRIREAKRTPFLLSAAHLDPALVDKDMRRFRLACFTQPVDIDNLKRAIAEALESSTQ